MLLAPAAVDPVGALGHSTGFALVGHSDLGGLGMHAGLALAGDCAYVGGPGGGRGALIIDVADPSKPRVVGELPCYGGSTARKVRTAVDRDLLAVLTYRLDGAPWGSPTSPNGLDVYRIDDCRTPALVGRVDFGDDLPHEFFLWRDPERRERVLAFVAMWGHAPNLRVVDLSDPAIVATWDAGSALGLPSRLHSLTVTPDAARAYLADWIAGLIVLDTIRLAAGRADPTPIRLTPPGAALLLPGGNLHSAVPVPGQDLVVTPEEIYGADICPHGRLHVVDVTDPAAPAGGARRRRRLRRAGKRPGCLPGDGRAGRRLQRPHADDRRRHRLRLLVRRWPARRRPV